jgi:hypothetical protein
MSQRKSKPTKRDRKAAATSAATTVQSLGTFDGIAIACAALEKWVNSARGRVDLSDFGAVLDNNDQAKVPVFVGKRALLSEQAPHVVWLNDDSTEMQVWVEEGDKGYTVTFAVFVERIRAAVAAEQAKNHVG